MTWNILAMPVTLMSIKKITGSYFSGALLKRNKMFLFGSDAKKWTLDDNIDYKWLDVNETKYN